MKLKNLFTIESDEKGIEPNKQEQIKIATCVLLIQIAKEDNQFSESEQKKITEILQNKFTLTDEEVDKLLIHSKKEIDKSIDLWQFTNQLNKNLSRQEKIKIIESVWEVIYADKKLDGHEDYLVHKFANLLRLDHKELIEAKLKVKNNE